jgi:hypothetical protein
MKTIAVCIVATLLGAASVDLVSTVARAQGASAPAATHQQTYTVRVTTSQPTVSSVSGGGTFPAGSTVTVYVTPHWTPIGWYYFDGFWENGHQVSPGDYNYVYTFKLTQDRNLVAYIVPN